MSFDHYDLLRRVEPPHELTHEHILDAVSHLYDALNLLKECEEIVQEGTYTLEFPAKLAQSWGCVNMCRVHTEEIVFMEDALIPAMGLIYDAKAMFESLVAWKLGMTKYGAINIVNAIREAMIGIRMCVEELEEWLGHSVEEPLSQESTALAVG